MLARVVHYAVIALVTGGAIFIALFPLMGYIYEQPPVRWTNIPFPTNDPVSPDEPLSTIVERCNDSTSTVMTTVARRLVREDTGQATTLPPGGGIVDPGGTGTEKDCTKVTGGIGLPPGVAPGRYHVEQIVAVEGRWRTFQIPMRTQSFTVREP